MSHQPGAAHWQNYPEWARPLREEILGRIKSEFRPPDYEYQDNGGGDSAPPAYVPAPPPIPAATTVTAKQRAALLLAIVLVLGIASGMGWLVKSGLQKGSTFFPSKQVPQQRPVSRQQEPATFWFAIGLYSAIGLGTGGLGLWGIREIYRRNPPTR